jgi:hypothetical protein
LHTKTDWSIARNQQRRAQSVDRLSRATMHGLAPKDSSQRIVETWLVGAFVVFEIAFGKSKRLQRLQ